MVMSLWPRFWPTLYVTIITIAVLALSGCKIIKENILGFCSAAVAEMHSCILQILLAYVNGY